MPTNPKNDGGKDTTLINLRSGYDWSGGLATAALFGVLLLVFMFQLTRPEIGPPGSPAPPALYLQPEWTFIDGIKEVLSEHILYAADYKDALAYPFYGQFTLKLGVISPTAAIGLTSSMFIYSPQAWFSRPLLFGSANPIDVVVTPASAFRVTGMFFNDSGFFSVQVQSLTEACRWPTEILLTARIGFTS